MKLEALVKEVGQTDEDALQIHGIETWTHCDVEGQEQAEQYAKEIVAKFNRSLRRGEKPRELVWVKIAGPDDPIPSPEPERMTCDDCGKEWTDTGDVECPFCGSTNIWSL